MYGEAERAVIDLSLCQVSRPHQLAEVARLDEYDEILTNCFLVWVLAHVLANAARDIAEEFVHPDCAIGSRSLASQATQQIVGEQAIVHLIDVPCARVGADSGQDHPPATFH